MDAEIDRADALLFRIVDTSDNADLGKCWLRNVEISEPADRITLGTQLAAANVPDAQIKWRAGVRIDQGPEAVAGLIRHELEHCRQYAIADPGTGLLNLHFAAQESLAPAHDLPGSNELYNKIPMELDADAAASCFARRKFGDARIDALVAAGNPHRALFRESGDYQRPSRKQLFARMRAFIDVEGPALAQEFASRYRTTRQ